MKKLTSLLTFIALFVFVIPVFAQSKPMETGPKDPQAGVEAPVEVIKLYKEEKFRMAYVKGCKRGPFQPNKFISRGEAAVFLARLSQQRMDPTGKKKTGFSDASNAWYSPSINDVVSKGFMKGYPGNLFYPEHPISRAEFMTMISRADKKARTDHPFTDLRGHWAAETIGMAYNNGRIKGFPDGTFRPNGNVTRAEAITIFNNLFERHTDNLSFRNTKKLHEMTSFVDVKPADWFYFEIMDAANDHYTNLRDANGKAEDWVRVGRD